MLQPSPKGAEPCCAKSAELCGAAVVGLKQEAVLLVRQRGAGSGSSRRSGGVGRETGGAGATSKWSVSLMPLP